MTEVNVAIYSPTNEGKLRHWAIWLKSPRPEESIILQITDNMYGFDYLVADPIFASPFDSERLERVIGCGTIQREDYEHAIDTILGHPVRNRGLNWNCQTWTIECLDLLAEMEIMETFAVGRARLESFRE